tara:strand:+ start:348 stop:803 length:456 start_codon:yes stop_codon:yes gene_type:complete
MTKEEFLEHCGWSEEEFDHIMHLLGQGFYRYVLSVTDRYDCSLNYLEDVKEHKDRIEQTAITWKDIRAEFDCANEMGAGLPKEDEGTRIERKAYESVSFSLQHDILGYGKKRRFREAIDFLHDVNAKGVSWADINKDVLQHLMPFLETQED